MLQEKAGNIAGLIWNALSEAQAGLTFNSLTMQMNLSTSPTLA